MMIGLLCLLRTGGMYLEVYLAELSSSQDTLILVDDLGVRDAAYAGSDFYETPNIDSGSRRNAIYPNLCRRTYLFADQNGINSKTAPSLLAHY